MVQPPLWGKKRFDFLKLEHTHTQGPSTPFTVYTLNRKAYVSVTKTCIKMFIAAFFIIAPHWNPPTCAPSVEWINKLCVHAIGYYTAMKMKELLLQVTWVNFINTMLSERNQTQEECTLYDSIYAEFKNRQKLTYGARSQDTCFFWGRRWDGREGGPQGGRASEVLIRLCSFSSLC